jgi:hypothetical protein
MSTSSSRLISKINKIKSYIKEKNENDYHINEEHKLLCKYREKYLELQQKLELRDIIKKIEYTKISKKNIEKDIISLQLYYNDYNEKFINKLYDNFQVEELNNIIYNNDIFLQSLSEDEINTIKYYTYHGDTIINQFLKGLFTIDWLIEYYERADESLFILTDINKNLLFLFNKQIYDYFQTDDWEYDNLLKNSKYDIFIKYCSINLDQYKTIFTSYINDLMKIFNKAPKLTSKLIVYRGIKSEYHLLNKKENIFVNKFFSSTSFLFDVAYKFINSNGIMQRITIDTGIPILFLEGITLNTEEYEILLPINTYYIIENPSVKIIPVFPSPLKKGNKSTINNILCKSDSINNIKISDLHLIGYTKSLKYIEKI